jgi:hypothetical protein
LFKQADAVESITTRFFPEKAASLADGVIEELVKVYSLSFFLLFLEKGNRYIPALAFVAEAADLNAAPDV